jgi:hypothetical protein
MLIFLSSTNNLPDPHRAARVLHFGLTSALTVISMVFLILGVMDVGPIIRGDDGVAIIGSVIAGISLIPLMVSMLILRPRVPTRASGQSDKEFWQGAIGSAMLVWTLAEAGGMMSLVGALISGHWAPIVVVVAALACMALVRPSYFENA